MKPLQEKYELARRRQVQLAALVSLRPLIDSPDTVAGLDVAYHSPIKTAFSAVTLFTYPKLEFLESHTASLRVDFPYIPGLLSFREMPSLLAVLKKLSVRPHILLVDGQGICHPRHIGLASHLGIAMGIASIGAAKSHLCGNFEMPPYNRGEHRPLFLDGEVVGNVLCTRNGVKPLFVSPGHLCNISDALRIVLDCCRGFRSPEPLRLAHKLAGFYKSAHMV